MRRVLFIVAYLMAFHARVVVASIVGLGLLAEVLGVAS
jgi:hypothetical protein